MQSYSDKTIVVLLHVSILDIDWYERRTDSELLNAIVEQVNSWLRTQSADAMAIQ